MKKLEENQNKIAKDWNDKYPVGTEVIVTKDDGSEILTKTSHKATVLGRHTAVAWLEGFSGCYCLERVRPLEAKRLLNMFIWDKDLEKILREHEGWVLSHAKISKILADYQKIKDEREKEKIL